MIHSIPRRQFEIKHGRDALLHSIGSNDCVQLEQLPSPGLCGTGDAWTTTAAPSLDPYRFGAALAVSFMKLLRPEAGYTIDIACWGDLSSYVERMQNADTRTAFLCGIETLLSLALLYPERLPALVERLDALDNEALTEQATQALLAEPAGVDANGREFYHGDDGGIFVGLTDAAGVWP